MTQRRRITGLLAAGMAAALALSACGSDDGDDGEDDGATRAAPGFEECVDDPVNCNSDDREDGGEMTWAISAGWEMWNTQRSEGNSVYVTQAMTGIFPSFGTFLPDGTFQWDQDLLVQEPELVSEDPQSWQYVISQDAKWMGGEQIGLDDFIWDWHMLSGDPEHCTDGCDTASSVGAGQYESIEGEENADGDQVITITLKDGEQNPEWQFAGPLSYPAYIADEVNPDWRDDPDAMFETMEYHSETVPEFTGGPYLIDPEATTLSETVVKTPNPEWYGETKPTLDKVIQVAVADQQATLDAIANGEHSGASPASLDPDVAEQALETPGMFSNLATGPGWEHLDINTTHEWLSDVELRRAIFTAVDVEDVIERTYAPLLPTDRRTNHIFRDDSEYHQDVITESGQGSGDVELATQILEDAGYTIEDGSLTKDGEAMPAINFRPLEGNRMRQITAEVVQAQLKEIGIEVEIQVIPSAELSPTLSNGDFDIVIFGWSGTPAFTTAPGQFYRSDSFSNYGLNKNEELDVILDSIRQTPDLAEAAERTNQALEMVVEDAYVLPLVSTPVLIMVGEQYANVRDTWASSLRGMYNMEEWGIRAN